MRDTRLHSQLRRYMLRPQMQLLHIKRPTTHMLCDVWRVEVRQHMHMVQSCVGRDFISWFEFSLCSFLLSDNANDKYKLRKNNDFCFIYFFKYKNKSPMQLTEYFPWVVRTSQIIVFNLLIADTLRIHLKYMDRSIYPPTPFGNRHVCLRCAASINQSINHSQLAPINHPTKHKVGLGACSSVLTRLSCSKRNLTHPIHHF